MGLSCLPRRSFSSLIFGALLVLVVASSVASEETTPSFALIDLKGIRRVDWQGSEERNSISPSSGTWLKIHRSSKKIYWVSPLTFTPNGQQAGYVKRSDFDGSNEELVWQPNPPTSKSLWGLTIDQQRNYIYWVVSGSLYRLNTTGGSPVAFTGLSFLSKAGSYDITLDEETNLLYVAFIPLPAGNQTVFQTCPLDQLNEADPTAAINCTDFLTYPWPDSPPSIPIYYNDDTIYWTEPDPTPNAPKAYIYHASTTSPAKTLLLQVPLGKAFFNTSPRLGGLVIVEDYLYFVCEFCDGVLNRVNLETISSTTEEFESMQLNIYSSPNDVDYIEDVPVDADSSSFAPKLVPYMSCLGVAALLFPLL